MNIDFDKVMELWPETDEIHGQGRFAVLTNCGNGLTVSLLESQSDAQQMKERCDSCKFACDRRSEHKVVSIDDKNSRCII